MISFQRGLFQITFLLTLSVSFWAWSGEKNCRKTFSANQYKRDQNLQLTKAGDRLQQILENRTFEPDQLLDLAELLVKMKGQTPEIERTINSAISKSNAEYVAPILGPRLSAFTEFMQQPLEGPTAGEAPLDYVQRLMQSHDPLKLSVRENIELMQDYPIRFNSTIDFIEELSMLSARYQNHSMFRKLITAKILLGLTARGKPRVMAEGLGDPWLLLHYSVLCFHEAVSPSYSAGGREQNAFLAKSNFKEVLLSLKSVEELMVKKPMNLKGVDWSAVHSALQALQSALRQKLEIAKFAQDSAKTNLFLINSQAAATNSFQDNIQSLFLGYFSNTTHETTQSVSASWNLEIEQRSLILKRFILAMRNQRQSFTGPSYLVAIYKELAATSDFEFQTFMDSLIRPSK